MSFVTRIAELFADEDRRIEALENKLREARNNCSALYGRLSVASLSAEEGEPGAEKRKVEASRAYDAASSRVTDLEAALEAAQNRKVERLSAEAAADEERRQEAARTLWDQIHEEAALVDQAIPAFAKHLRSIAAKENEIRALFPEINPPMANAYLNLRYCIAWHCRFVPGFSQSPFFSDERARFVSYIPEFETLLHERKAAKR